MRTRQFLMVGLLVASSAAQAQFNVLNVITAAKNAAQQVSTPASGSSTINQASPTSHATPAQESANSPYGEYEVASRGRPYANLKFEDYFNCRNPTTKPPLASSISLRGITLGDVCALPDEILSTRYGTNEYHGQLRGFLIQAAVDTRRETAEQSFDSDLLTLFDADGKAVKIGVFTSFNQAPGLAKAVIASVEETVCAADPTNSLQPGNSFRLALERKYGKPAVEVSLRDAIREHDQATKRASQQYGSQSEAYQDAIDRDSLEYRNWSNTLPPDTVVALHWATSDGVALLVERSPDGCGVNPAFDIGLLDNPSIPAASQFLVREWAQPVVTFDKSQMQARSATAPVPKF